MKTISILSQKGGAGKTTLAINLAGVAEATGKQAVIIDLDPQASAKAWYDRRGKESPVVISAQAVVLADVLRTAAEHGADVAIIDTAPHSETAALAAGKAADLILVPCRVSYVDLKAIETTIDLVRIARKPALFVLTCIRPGDKALPNSAETHLSQYSIPVSPQRITQRAAFVHALTAGQAVTEFEPEGVAASEIRELFTIACNHGGMMTSWHDLKETVNA